MGGGGQVALQTGLQRQRLAEGAGHALVAAGQLAGLLMILGRLRPARKVPRQGEIVHGEFAKPPGLFLGDVERIQHDSRECERDVRQIRT